MKFSDMSPRFQELLIRVKESQIDGFYDPRGYYAEFDSFDCKPYTHIEILEAQVCPWVTIHKESDEAHELGEDEIEIFENDDGDEWEETIEDSCSGVCFITIKPEFLDQIIED